MFDKGSPAERERLEAIQRSVDGPTTAVLAELPVQPSWHCLELGAGAGSIAYWLAGRCPAGRVTAVDIDARYLDPTRAPNLEIQQADISDPRYAPGEFDLVHARYLFCHLPDRDEVLARAAGWLRPGGWLFVEEPYQLPPGDSPFPVVRRLMAGYERRYAAHGADLRWARGLPAALAAAGLAEVSFTGSLGCMGGLAADRWAPIIRQAGPGLVADGLVSEADLAEFSALLTDPSFVDIPQVTVRARGRRWGVTGPGWCAANRPPPRGW